MNACACCDKSVESHRTICCCVCKKKYFIDCVSVTATIARQINQNSSFTWTCEKCKCLGSDINELKSCIINLQLEISALKESINSPSSPSRLTSLTDVEKIVREVAEREKRKHNIIVYGSPELASTRDEQKVLDTTLVQDILTFLPVACNIVSTTRLGKFDPTAKHRRRPIKIQLPSEGDVLSVVRNSNKLKKSGFSNISVSRDSTPMQRELYLSVKSEMQQRIENGERNLRIKYKSGIPTIVQLNPEN